MFVFDLRTLQTLNLNMQKVKVIQASCCSGTDDIFHISSSSSHVQPHPPFLLLYSPQVFSNFWDLLPPLLPSCWPWNQFLMGAQWPRAEPTCCIQMWPPAIISRLPTLYKHSFNKLSSRALLGPSGSQRRPPPAPAADPASTRKLEQWEWEDNSDEGNSPRFCFIITLKQK